MKSGIHSSSHDYTKAGFAGNPTRLGEARFPPPHELDALATRLSRIDWQLNPSVTHFLLAFLGIKSLNPKADAPASAYAVQWRQSVPPTS